MTRRAVSQPCQLASSFRAALCDRRGGVRVSAADRAVELSQPQTTDAGCTAARNAVGGLVERFDEGTLRRDSCSRGHGTLAQRRTCVCFHLHSRPARSLAVADDGHPSRLSVDGWMEGHTAVCTTVGSRSVKPFRPLTSAKCRGDVNARYISDLAGVDMHVSSHRLREYLLDTRKIGRRPVFLWSDHQPPSARVCKRKAKLAVSLQATLRALRAKLRG
jgi:hypothetical protein